MIPKGNQRAGGQDLATHLMNSFDNEQVELYEIRGAVAQDLHGAFAEWEALAKTTKATEPIYSLSLSPDHRKDERFERAMYLEFFDRAEARLCLTGQPRAIVFHIKEGREHAHCVWSRIDTEKMKAIQLSNDRMQLRSVAQEFARDHGIELPDGMKNDRGKDRYKDRKKQTDLGENQQKERTGEKKEERSRKITKAWRESDNTQSFIKALEEHGYHLAKGDKRAIVVVDRFGEVHSLARQIDGVRQKDVTARITDFDKLPDITAAREKAKQFAIKETEREDAAAQRAERQADIERRRQRMLAEQEKRKADLDQIHKDLSMRHGHEAHALDYLHRATDHRIASDRAARQPKGIRAFLARVTGLKAAADRKQTLETIARQAEQLRQKDDLMRRHQREQAEIERRRAALERIAVRERAALETRLKREELQRAAEDRIYQLDRQKEEKRLKGLSKAFAEAMQRHEVHKPEGKEKADMRATTRSIFNRVADRLHQPDARQAKDAPEHPKTLSEQFAAANERHEPHKPEGKEREDLRHGLKGSFNTEAEKTAETDKGDGKGDTSLHNEFGRSAERGPGRE